MRYFSKLIVLFLLFFMCGCKSRLYHPNQTISEANNGQTIKLKNGEILGVEIYSPSPSTGYHWDIEPFDTSKLEQLQPDSDFEDCDKPGCGGGKVTLNFRALAAGVVPLRLTLRPPGTKTPERSFSVTLEIRE